MPLLFCCLLDKIVPAHALRSNLPSTHCRRATPVHGLFTFSCSTKEHAGFLRATVIHKTRTNTSPWSWVPSLYLAEGLPLVVVLEVSVILYKNLDVSNATITFYTSWLYLPWVIKPLWSPVVDLLKTRRLWIWTLQLVIGAAFASVALTLPGENFLRWSLALFWLIAFSSATHDVAADGLYLLVLNERQQSFFVGIRSTFYRVATIAGQGLLVMLAGWLWSRSGDARHGWMIAFTCAGVFLLVAGTYHALILPRVSSDAPGRVQSLSGFLQEFWRTFVSFVRKPRIAILLLFLLLYRFAEAQLVKLAKLFLLDSPDVGGLGLSTEQVGFVYGTVGIIALTVGGVLGGFLVSRHGLKRWLWPMVALMNVPNAVYVVFAMLKPDQMAWISMGVAVEQFGYGFGFTAYMMYMIRIARGPHQTAHYAICTGFMALGMMLPGMFSGALQEWLGYKDFFLWVMLATVPSFVVCALIPLGPDFGRRTETA